MKTIVNQISAVKTSLLICLMALAGSSFGQQLYYSQYQLTPMLNNPSLIGLSEELKVDVGYRNQFGGKGSNYGTPVVAAVMPFYKESVQNVFTKIGVGGIQVLTDRTGYSGLLATTGFSLTYAHMVNISRKDKFSFGLQPGVYQRRVDFGKLESGSQWDAFNGSYDQGLPLNENIAQTERRTFFSINSGITYIRENEAGEPFLTLAVAANNMTRPNISLNDKSFSNPLYWNFQGSVVAYENEQFIVKPTARHIQAQNLNQTNIGSYVYYKIDQPKGFLSRGNIGLGAWYSNQNAVVLALEINQRDWALGFSYDFLTSSLADVRNSTGAPEIVVGFRKYLGKKKAPLPDMSGSKKSGGKDGGGELKEPKKVEPSKSEMTPEPAVKPADPKAGEENKPAVEREQTERKDEVKPVEPKPEPEPAEAVPTKPAEKPAKKEPAEKPAPKKAGAKGKKAAAQKNATPKSNLDPAMTEKMSKVRTSDADLGKDPYEGTPLALTKAQRDVFKKQPHYGKGGFELDQIAKDQLNAIAKMMKERPNMKLEIQGYGCDLGGPEVTKVISLGRAESTRRYLISKGIPADRLETKAMGVEKPIGDNSTEENKIINRRVQFKFL